MRDREFHGEITSTSAVKPHWSSTSNGESDCRRKKKRERGREREKR